MTTYHPGVTEIEWLAELTPLAERIGAEVFGKPIRWRVETRITLRRTRSDVVVELADTGAVLITGEAKRPDDLHHGVTPLDVTEVDDAVTKAQHHGARWCFTTNFFQLAVFDAGPGMMASPLSRLEGNVLEFIPSALGNSRHWWTGLTTEQRTSAVEPGLRRLFERCAALEIGEHPGVPIGDVVLDVFSQLTGQLVDPLWREFLRRAAANTTEVRQHALIAGLDPNDNQQVRYLIAQGVFEVLTGALFYKLLAAHFEALPSLLGGTAPRSASTLRNTVVASLHDAESVSGDYESILELSPIGEWVLSNAPRESVRHWVALLIFIDRLDLSAISSDVLGSIFERLISPERRHEMGQHYTQPRLAKSMAAWGVRDDAEVVLDPACGAGTFLVETYARLRALNRTHQQALNHTFGNDLDSFAVHLAAINLATRRIAHGLNHPLVRHGDAFDLRPGLPMVVVAGTQKRLVPPTLIIANPPYGRSHPDEAEARAVVQRLFGARYRVPDTTGINFAAWFTLLSAGLLAQSGRMAFVLPSAVLQNENLDDWRRWLRQYWDIVIWHTEHDVWFSDARVAPCVALFTPRVSGGQAGAVHFASVQEPASGVLIDVDGIPCPSAHSTVRDLSALDPGSDLLIAGTTPESLIDFGESPKVRPLGELPEAPTINAGQKLGHAFFQLRDLQPTSRAIIREVEGADTRVRIPKRYLTPMLSSPKELTRGNPILSNWVLTLPETLPTHAEVRSYIRHGIQLGVDQAPSVSARNPWWSIEPQKWDIAVPMNGQFRHEVALLQPQAAAKNNFNCLRFSDPIHSQIVAASLASAFGALARLYISGEVGCEGARRVLLIQFKQWPVLAPSLISKQAAKRILEAYSTWREFDVSEIDDMPPAELAAWRALTLAVAKAAFPNDGAKAEALAASAIEESLRTTSRRRARETLALSGRTRGAGGGGNALSVRIRRWVAESQLFPNAVHVLSSGSRIASLRPLSATENFRLFADDHPLAEYPDAEGALGGILGVGFEAALPELHQGDDAKALVQQIQTLFEEVTTDLVGEQPPEGPGRETWNQLASEVQNGLRRMLQSAVRAALS